MPTKIFMPALSPTMTEGSLTKWLVKIGDKVSAGDVIAEIETDKATMEVEAVDEGVVTHLLISEGSTLIEVNSTIAILDGDINEGSNMEEAEDSKNRKLINVRLDDKNLLSTDGNKSVNIDKDTSVTRKNKIEKKLNDNFFSSPYVRMIAKEKDIKLDKIKGSGPKGRIIKRDIEKKIEDNFVSNEKADYKIINPSSMRKIIAERTTHTKQTVPHFYLTIESNVDKLLEMRRKINENSEVKISINDLLVKALAEAQKMNPLTNISWIDGQIMQYKSVDVSIAVALKDGLVTPIIKNADKKGLKEISIEIKDLAEKAKKGKLQPKDYVGGTISISNLGMFGISEFSAIINPPQSSILAVGVIKKIPVINDNSEIKIASVLKSTLSADHRALDGAVAGKLLKDYNEIIENPYDLWLASDDMDII